MSDNPNALDKVLLESADPQLREQFLRLLAEQKDSHELQKTHQCWSFIPTPAEYERMRKFAPTAENPTADKCPKCGKGRLVIEIYHGNIGDSLNVVCRRGVVGCDFKEYVSDDE